MSRGSPVTPSPDIKLPGTIAVGFARGHNDVLQLSFLSLDSLYDDLRLASLYVTLITCRQLSCWTTYFSYLYNHPSIRSTMPVFRKSGTDNDGS